MEIKIGKPGRACCATEREFVHGEQVVSLVRMEDQHYVREDFAEEAWDPARSPSAIAVWTTTYVDPRVAEQEPPETFTPMRQIFYESVADSERVSLATAYLAAELLRRQKVFRLVKQSVEGEEEGRIALYNDRIGNRLVEVRDPNLSIAELEAGRVALIARLQELEAPEEDESADDGEASGDESEPDEAAAEAEAAEDSDDDDEFVDDDEDDEFEDDDDDDELDVDEFEDDGDESEPEMERVVNGDV